MSELLELVDLSVMFPSLHVDFKCATADNIIGAPIYREARCLLHTETAATLAKSVSTAQLAGLQLVVYDTYHPQQAQVTLWNACPDPRYVIDVAIGSSHSRGTVIDITLIDDHNHLLNTGTGFGEMHDRSHAWHPSVPPAAQRNRLLLSAIMFGSGFIGINSEWWHPELPDAIRCPLLDDQIGCCTITPITTQHPL